MQKKEEENAHPHQTSGDGMEEYFHLPLHGPTSVWLLPGIDNSSSTNQASTEDGLAKTVLLLLGSQRQPKKSERVISSEAVMATSLENNSMYTEEQAQFFSGLTEHLPTVMLSDVSAAIQPLLKHEECTHITSIEVAEQKAMYKIKRMLSVWFYRCKLVVATFLIMWGLFIIQGSLKIQTEQVSLWQDIVRWGETVWLIPVPVAFIFWIGWFVFAQQVQPNPSAIDVPWILVGSGINQQYSPRRVRLVFRIVTRGENVDVLSESIRAIHKGFIHYPAQAGSYRIEIVTECPIDIDQVMQSKVCVFIVPKDYATVHKSRFKARAMSYLQERTHPLPEDWHIYLDEESAIDEIFIAGVYQFIARTLKKMENITQKCPKGIIGQGAIIYHGGRWFFRAADAMRTGDDLGRFRLQYGIGVPAFGMHGSFIVVRGIDDALLSFDVGPTNSIAEDAAWALHAWYKGYRFAWVDGYLYEQPPQTFKDFVRQRSRWLIGIRNVLKDPSLPLRYKFWLGIFTYSWHLSLFPTIVAILAVVTRTIAFSWIQVPANFAWAVFFLSYLQGMSKQVQCSLYFFNRKKASFFYTLCQKVAIYVLALGVFWYTLLESYSIFFSCIRPHQGFFVIKKPNLNAHHREVPI